MDASILFSPIKINLLELKSRVVCGPLTTNYAELDGRVNDRLLAYYRRRAAGGAGLVIVEGSFICQEGRGYIKQVGIHDDRMIPGLTKLARAIKEQGARASIQIQHCGRRTGSKLTGLPPLAPSAVPVYQGAEVPREMTEDDILTAIKQFAAAARRAREAGFDSVDVHSAHGYLPAAFLSPLANHRTDRWGGSFENRSRFLVEVVKAIKEEAGWDFPVSVKFSADEYLEGGITLTESQELAELLERNGVDFLQVSAGAPGGKNLADLNNPHTFMRTLPMGTSPGCLVYLANEIKKKVSIPVVAIGRLADPPLAERVIKEGRADLVSLARALLADPQWPVKVKEGRLSDIRPCISCNDGCYSRVLAQEEVTCTVNPEVGREFLELSRPAANIKSVVVAGGGPAGMEAALVAASRGHRVVLVEKEEQLGGQLNVAHVPPDRDDIKKLRDYLAEQMEKVGVRVITGTALSAGLLDSLLPDALIVATGSVPVVPRFAEKGTGVVTAHDVLRGGRIDLGRRVLVAGGGLVGCETADYLAERCDQVILVEMLDEIARDASAEERDFLKRKLTKKSVSVLTGAKIVRIEGNRVSVEQSGVELEFEVDSIVLAMGSSSCLSVEGMNLSPEMIRISAGGREVSVYFAGDCERIGKIIDAVHRGFDVAVGI
ncbi:MAG: FAD-dependent oxidoreductase [Peptococcaceae bacterium]|nr:FAD-dependent oxidoreductase [Peptococcaceae bacterium]